MTDVHGLLIAFFGPDGSGKSTVADLFNKKCAAEGRGIKHMHWRPGVLPYRNRKACSNDRASSDPQGVTVRRGMKGWLIGCYCFLDFLLGYLFVIRPALKRGTIVCYERYIHDVLIDSRRYGLDLPEPFRKWIVRLIPQPDLFFLFDAPADLLHSRKQELTVDEIERQRLLLRKHIGSKPSCHEVDVLRNNPEACCNLIFDVLTCHGSINA